MRGMLAGLTVAVIIIVIALAVATLASLGVAAIGWLLSHWFDLTQWQGSLIGLAVALTVGIGVYRLTTANDIRGEPDWIEWEEDEEDEDEEENEPPVVPWRRQRPTPGQLPGERPKPRRSQGKQR